MMMRASIVLSAFLAAVSAVQEGPLVTVRNLQSTAPDNVSSKLMIHVSVAAAATSAGCLLMRVLR